MYLPITDGQIYLESDLFNAGIRPAVNVGLSVSRVGGAAQTKAMKKVAGTLRLELAQYREKQAFAQFGSDLDPATQAQLSRGARLVEILKQEQYSPLPFEMQVISILAVVSGEFDSLPVEKIREAEAEVHSQLLTSHGEVISKIKESKALEDDTREKVLNVVRSVVKNML
jgi:F-type H+/Na+-transporting ATPase subunit alpha